MNVPANFEGLPQELSDLIVDHISRIPDKKTRIASLSSMAMVSKRFRYRAHKHIFAAISLRKRHFSSMEAAIDRLFHLKDLLAADPHSEGIASHIHSFHLSLGGNPPSVASALEGDTLPFIFRKLFRNGNRPCSLSIFLFVPGDSHQLDWTTLTDDFRCALLDLVRATHLSALRFRGIRNLPDDILTFSSVNHINFKNISLQHCTPRESGVSTSEPPSYSVQPRRDYVQLHSMEVDHSFPIFDVLDFTPTRSQPLNAIFHKLRNLTVKINNSDGFAKSMELFQSTTRVESLEVKLNYISNRAKALSFQSLSLLRHLRLVHRRFTPRFMNGQTDATVQDMINILGSSQLPGSLRSMSINLSLAPCYGDCFEPETPSSDVPDQLGHDSGESGHSAMEKSEGTETQDTADSDPILCDSTPHPEKSMISTANSIPATMTIIKRIFEPWSPESNNLKALDDLLGDTSVEAQDRFRSVRYLTFRLEVEVHRVPEEYTKNMEQEFAEQAAEYVASEYFPKVKEKFERVDDSDGGFRVFILARFRRTV